MKLGSKRKLTNDEGNTANNAKNNNNTTNSAAAVTTKAAKATTTAVYNKNKKNKNNNANVNKNAKTKAKKNKNTIPIKGPNKKTKLNDNKKVNSIRDNESPLPIDSMRDNNELLRIKRLNKFATNSNLSYTSHVIASSSSSSSLSSLTPGKSNNLFDPHVDDYSNLNKTQNKSIFFDKDKPVIGKCQILPKSYLRLTSEPNPLYIRPFTILQKWFIELIEKYNNKEVNYIYVCDQLKAIRQDLRVQMIENKFTIKVYQTHSRIALENMDLGEFNQCQSRLLQLYSLNNLKKSNYDEFIIYLTLYYIMMNDMDSIVNLRSKLISESIEIYRNPDIQNVLQLANFIIRTDYHNFFINLNKVVGYGRYLVKTFIDRERLNALCKMCSTYNQLPVEFILEELFFSDLNEFIDFLGKFKLNDELITKTNPSTNQSFKFIDGKKSKLIFLRAYHSIRKVDIKGQK